jgi:hypothetical protein|tara:strand:+ start:1083 stop:1823 length:741 start_codon:yes stop_codon:yes gene_type:complete|mmetsp:Transcript_3/g.13  ORF Transcript_3/g.13 Transcript_3/m.13 type:complete len:247 (+) Transcript_3:151-891(+)
MNTTTSDEPAGGSLQHLPPRKRLLAQMAAGNVFGENKEVGGGASSQPAVPKESDVPNKPNLPPAVMSVLKEKNKKPRPMIPESDLIKAARARAAAAASGAEPALVVNPAMNPNLNPTPNAASDIKASITAKAEAAAESRRSAVASAAAAASAATAAARFATLAEEAKTMATSLKQARAVRVAAAAQDKTNTQTQAEVQKPNETREADATDDALATRLHRETNHASPRRGEDAIEKSPNSVPPSVAP